MASNLAPALCIAHGDFLNIAILGGGNIVGTRVEAALREQGRGLPSRLDARLDSAAAVMLLQGCTAVVNCTLGKPEDIRAAATRLQGWLTALPAPPRLIHLSSMTVYGSAEGCLPEHAPLVDDLSPYASAQIAAERVAARTPRSVILRPGCEYGPGVWPWSGRVARWLEARRLGDLGETGEGICNLLYIDDLVAAIVRSLDAPDVEGRALNLGSAAPPSWNGYFARFAEALGVAPVRSIPPRRLMIETRLLAPPLKILELIASRLRTQPRWLPPPIPPSLPALCRQKIRLDVSAAEAALGLQWTELDEGLKRTAAARKR